MANLFDSVNYPTTEPSVLIAGDRVTWKKGSLGVDYPSASYSLKYSARLEGSINKEIEITATASGDDYLIEVPAATSALWTAGTYQWQSYIIRTSDSERKNLASGVFEVKSNMDTANVDPRSKVKKMLDQVEDAIVAFQGGSIQSYSVGGRVVTYRNLTELIVFRDKLKGEYQRELDKIQFEKLGHNPRRIGLRLKRV